MAQRKFAQAIVVFAHGGAAGSAGVVAPVQQADGDASGFASHLRAVAIQFVENGPVILTVRCDEGTAVAERVIIPVSTVVGFAQAIHPGEGAGLQQHPLGDFAEVLGPEVETLPVGYR